MARTLAVLNLKKRIGDIIVFGRHVANSMRNNPDFPSPPRALANLVKHVGAASRAHARSLSRTKGAADTCRARIEDVRQDLRQLCVYVQGRADAASPEEAARIIVSAGLFIKGRIARMKQRLAARSGKTSGTVHLTAKFAGKEARYAWAYSVDGETWTLVPPTMKAKTTIASLAPGTVHFFRVRAVTRKGTEDWTAPIAFLVV